MAEEAAAQMDASGVVYRTCLVTHSHIYAAGFVPIDMAGTAVALFWPNRQHQGSIGASDSPSADVPRTAAEVVYFHPTAVAG